MAVEDGKVMECIVLPEDRGYGHHNKDDTPSDSVCEGLMRFYEQCPRATLLKIIHALSSVAWSSRPEADGYYTVFNVLNQPYLHEGIPRHYKKVVRTVYTPDHTKTEADDAECGEWIKARMDAMLAADDAAAE
jgi:hypothetical protein